MAQATPGRNELAVRVACTGAQIGSRRRLRPIQRLRHVSLSRTVLSDSHRGSDAYVLAGYRLERKTPTVA